MIPKDESVQILRRIGKISDINSNFLSLSEHQAKLETSRLSLYLQGIAAGAFLVFILLSFLFTSWITIFSYNSIFKTLLRLCFVIPSLIINSLNVIPG